MKPMGWFGEGGWDSEPTLMWALPQVCACPGSRARARSMHKCRPGSGWARSGWAMQALARRCPSAPALLPRRAFPHVRPLPGKEAKRAGTRPHPRGPPAQLGLALLLHPCPEPAQPRSDAAPVPPPCAWGASPGSWMPASGSGGTMTGAVTLGRRTGGAAAPRDPAWHRGAAAEACRQPRRARRFRGPGTGPAWDIARPESPVPPCCAPPPPPRQLSPCGAHSSPPPPPPCLQGLCSTAVVPKSLGFDPNRTVSEFRATEGTASPACRGDRGAGRCDTGVPSFCRGKLRPGGMPGQAGWAEPGMRSRRGAGRRPKKGAFVWGGLGVQGGAPGPAPGQPAPAPCRPGMQQECGAPAPPSVPGQPLPGRVLHGHPESWGWVSPGAIWGAGPAGTGDTTPWVAPLPALQCPPSRADGTGGFPSSNWCSYTVTRTVSCHVQNGTFLQRVFQGCRWPLACSGGR